MLDRQSRLAHVQSELAKYGGRKETGSYYTFICCPYHDDSTPSGQIFHGAETRNPGYFRCLGCGTRKSWNALARDLGLEPIGRSEPVDQFANALVGLAEDYDENDDPDFDLHELPDDAYWRGFPTKFLKRVGCSLGVYPGGHRFLYLPVVVGGTERGYVRARLKKDETGEYPSYLNKKGPWSRKYGLFPFDYAINQMEKLGSRSIVLVEGPRDSLRLLQTGIPAMSVLGTQVWETHKSRLLELHGVERAILMFDGDPAGIKATRKIQADLRKLVETVVIPLWSIKGSPYPQWLTYGPKKRKRRKHELWDPGNCPPHILRTLKSRYFGG